tara:strand:- start:18 stop:314 length:297 start_codon:yes stop_codon:yes gene_type:complete
MEILIHGAYLITILILSYYIHILRGDRSFYKYLSEDKIFEKRLRQNEEYLRMQTERRSLMRDYLQSKDDPKPSQPGNVILDYVSPPKENKDEEQPIRN